MAQLIGWVIKVTSSYDGSSNVDHTYVTSSDGHAWGCWGRSEGGQIIVQPVTASSKQADFMSSPNSHAGLAYGSTGVCHQTANRILYFTGKIVSAARGYAASSAMFGTYGRGQHCTTPGTPPSCRIPDIYVQREWRDRIRAGSKISGDITSEALTQSTNQDSNEDTMMQNYVTKVRMLYEEQMDETNSTEMSLNKQNDYLAQELDLLLDFRLGDKKNSEDVKHLHEYQSAMLAKKNDFYEELIKNNISPEEYANKLNNLISDFLKKSVTQLGKEKYSKLFNLEPDETVQIVDPEIIKISQQ